MATALRHLSQQEQLNFLLSNRVPRRALTRFMGWYSRIESARLARISLALWRMFADDLELQEAEQQEFNSLQACFTRRLKPGARPIDSRAEILVSPCDAIVGECGRVQGTTVFQAKGFPYEIGDLIPDPVLQQTYRDGCYVTLRLKSSMYHRFHAPLDCTVEEVSYISGDTWNVNPVALKRSGALARHRQDRKCLLGSGGRDSGRQHEIPLPAGRAGPAVQGPEPHPLLSALQQGR
jgi:phosphatidylserine decarboxylase